MCISLRIARPFACARVAPGAASRCSPASADLPSGAAARPQPFHFAGAAARAPAARRRGFAFRTPPRPAPPHYGCLGVPPTTLPASLLQRSRRSPGPLPRILVPRIPRRSPVAVPFITGSLLLVTQYAECDCRLRMGSERTGQRDLISWLESRAYITSFIGLVGIPAARAATRGRRRPGRRAGSIRAPHSPHLRTP
eukprot:gene16992-biopygen15204